MLYPAATFTRCLKDCAAGLKRSKVLQSLQRNSEYFDGYYLSHLEQYLKPCEYFGFIANYDLLPLLLPIAIMMLLL